MTLFESVEQVVANLWPWKAKCIVASKTALIQLFSAQSKSSNA